MSLTRVHDLGYEADASSSRLRERSAAAQPIARDSIPFGWMGIAFAAGLGLAAAVFVIYGTGEASVVTAVRFTARWAFILFWLGYAGGAVAALCGPPFRVLAGRGREFGLAYASALLVHLGLVAWLFQISARPPLAGGLLYFFVVGALFTYLLSVFSVGGLAKSLGSRGWRLLRFAGMNYILYAFARDFIPLSIHGLHHYGKWRFFQYAPFAAMSIAAPLLVIAAAMYRRRAV